MSSNYEEEKQILLSGIIYFYFALSEGVNSLYRPDNVDVIRFYRFTIIDIFLDVSKWMGEVIFKTVSFLAF